MKDGANNSEALASVFEERAENLSQTELESWTTYTQRDELLIEKLIGPGAKLLSGPRGSGKSTLLRTAYYRLLQSQQALPIYVNYAKSLALEPMFHRQANAIPVFRQWLLMKIVVGVYDTVSELRRIPFRELEELAASGKLLLNQLGSGAAPSELVNPISPSELVDRLEAWSTDLGFKRTVLLLDDAAHAFSPEQQREFFEVFRELRSRRVSPKAAVYPGITSYSPYFHVGHEAETLEAWYEPEGSGYLTTMRSLVRKRLPHDLRDQLDGRDDLIDMLALASFGLPRGFLNMIAELLDEGPATRQRAERAVADHAESVRGIFRALASKLPRYRHFVDMGKELESAVVRTLASYNKLQDKAERRTTMIGIEEPIIAELERMLNMLEYAGVVRQENTISRGEKGKFRRYAVHYAILISENALSLGKSYPLSDLIDSLRVRSSSAFARAKATSLLGDDFQSKCTLALPPCAKCETPRIAEEQRFCMKCGSQLADASVYEELLRASVSELALTEKKIDGIARHTSIKSVHDVLLDDERQELRTVPGIGPVWAKRIRNMAEEFVSV